MLLLAVLFLLVKICKAQTNWTYSTNLFGANEAMTLVYIGTGSSDTNRDNLYRMFNAVNHNTARFSQMFADNATNSNTLSNRVNTTSNRIEAVNLSVTNYAVRPYQTNVTLVAATTLVIYFPAFPDLTTNYVVTAPNQFVAATTTAKGSNNFTLGFTAITLTSQTIEGAVIRK